MYYVTKINVLFIWKVGVALAEYSETGMCPVWCGMRLMSLYNGAKSKIVSQVVFRSAGKNV